MGSKVDLMHAATGHVILAHLSEDARERAIEEWRSETKKRKPVDLDEHLAKIRARGHERRASYEVAGVMNISFPVLNVQGQAIAGLTVPFVKRIEDTIGIAEAVTSLREASRRISEAMGATPQTKPGPPTRHRPARKKTRLVQSGPETSRDTSRFLRACQQLIVVPDERVPCFVSLGFH